MCLGHYEGKAHKHKVEEYCYQTGLNIPYWNARALQDTEGYCKYCQMNIIGDINLMTHRHGKKHEKNKKKYCKFSIIVIYSNKIIQIFQFFRYGTTVGDAH